MRSKHFLGLCLVGSFTAIALAATGCGGDSGTAATTTGSGGDGGGTTTTTATTTTTGSNTTSTTTTGSNTTSSGTGGATGNHNFEGAIDIEVNPAANTTGTLVDADTTADFYKFVGTKNQRITAVAIAQGLFTDAGHDPNDVTVVDTVVTIYDSAKKKIAQNDDQWPRSSTDSQAFTVLPADGNYYVTVNSFCTEFSATPGACDNAGGVTTLDYELFLADVDKLNAPEVNEGAEPNDDDKKAVKNTYTAIAGTPGAYSISIIDGTFQTATDIDAYALNIPADLKFDAKQRAHAEFWVQAITPDNGTGATANAKLWVVDSDDLTKRIAEVDQVNYSDGANQTNGPIDMSVPIVAGHTYYLFVQHGAGASVPVEDFYFIKHFAGSYYYGQLEATPSTNDTILTAEKLTTPAMVTAGNYFVDGNLTTIVDVDYYTVDVAAGAKTASLFCDAQRQGSGLRGAKFSLLNPDGSALGAGAVLTEVKDKDAYFSGMTAVAIPATTTKVILKVEAASQDPLVTGSYYHCTVSVAAPAP